MSVGTALEVVTAVGATLGAIGVVTGDKNLAMVGGVIGAIGGIGALASSAGVIAGDAPLFGASTASNAGSITASAADNAAGAVGDTVTGANSLASGAPGSITQGAGMSVADAASSGKSAVDAIASGTTVADQASAGIVGSITNPTPEAAADPFSAGANAQWNLVSKSDATNPAAANSVGAGNTAAGTLDTGLINNAPASTGAGPAAATPPPGASATGFIDSGNFTDVTKDEAKDTSIFGSILDFAKKNPAVAMGVIQAGGSFISGMTSTLTPAQANAANAQAAANNAAAALTVQQTANLAMPKAVASSTPVTGTPAPLVPQGLINQPPKINVTGAP
jgi:hypothetical protein